MDKVKELETRLATMKAAEDAQIFALRAEERRLIGEMRTMKARERVEKIERKIAKFSIPEWRPHLRALYEAADQSPAFQTFTVAGKQRDADGVIDAFIDALDNPGLWRELGLTPGNGKVH